MNKGIKKKVHKSFNSPSKKLSDLEVLSKSWAEVELPIDILLTTVDKYGFLCCFYFLRVFKSFQLALGHIYFGEMGKTNSKGFKER